MQSVGHHLQIEAVRPAHPEADIFARSAFNRYYYASFLTTRAMLERLDPDFVEGLGHASYPDFLVGRIAKEFKRAKRTASKLGDADLLKKCEKAIHAAHALSEQFKKANSVRIVADYHPNQPIEFDAKDRYSLNKVNITEAHSWNQNTFQFSNIIETAWRQLSE